MASKNYRQNEVSFCNDVTKWAMAIFAADSTLPFGDAKIEEYGQGSLKRQDLRFYERKPSGAVGKLVLCGEAKLPGTLQGKTPFNFALVEDAFGKASRAGCRYFFTWNVEKLALFDCQKADKPMLERFIGQWDLGRSLDQPEDVTDPLVIEKIRNELLPRFFADFAKILRGERDDFALPLSDLYLNVLETHLTGPLGPVRELKKYLALESDRNPVFDRRLTDWMTAEQQWNFNRADPDSWRDAIDRAARTMVYILSNRVLFYQAVRARNQLPELKFPDSVKTPEKALNHLCRRFHEAVDVTGDYEPVFFPEDTRFETQEEREWAALAALSGENSIEAWNGVIEAVENFKFKEIPSDILGGIFQKLISPEERHKFGQHYTNEDLVDLMNAFCIRRGEAAVLDPSCGSGSFLVRAYYRKSHLDKGLTNQELIAGLYGCDINPFPAHLATLNLASRNISNEENYPRIARKNFFTVNPNEVFCRLPTRLRDEKGKPEYENIKLPQLDAVIGNPPYVRYQDIPKKKDTGVIPDQTREHLLKKVATALLPADLHGQSDLHLYFWPVAGQFLKPDGWFGFLTSSSWLDARYGFALQKWLLENFRVIAIIESADEPWFEDARVKTCVTIARRCTDAANRDDNLVRFVRLSRPLGGLLGKRETEEERQNSAEKLRDVIEKVRGDVSNERMRILVRRQGDLWREGISISEMFTRIKNTSENETPAPEAEEVSPTVSVREITGYGGGKWGRFLRAPDFYFNVMRRYGSRFVRVGDVARITYGILSGCDGFFMPRDVTQEMLARYPDEKTWRDAPFMQTCKRRDAESGKIRLVECGDGTVHPIESEYLRPEVHSLMKVDRPAVRVDEIDRFVLWCNAPLEKIKGTLVHKFITWGSSRTFASNKSKPVPIPERPGCAGRTLWYDLTGKSPGIGFWPMTQKYRHIVPFNPDKLACNHRLFDIHPIGLTDLEAKGLMAILNSTWVGLAKHFFGRYAGTEGTLDTEIVDVHLLEVPSPKGMPVDLLTRLCAALDKLCEREVTHLVEQPFLDSTSVEEIRELQNQPLGLPLELQHADRRELDSLVFELLGGGKELVDLLYSSSTAYYRALRVQEVQANLNKTKLKTGNTKVSPGALAEEAWKQIDPVLHESMARWIAARVQKKKWVELPEGEPRLPGAEHLFEATTLSFGKKPVTRLECESREEAELLFQIAMVGVRGRVCIPEEQVEIRETLDLLRERLADLEESVVAAARSIAGSDKLRDQVASTLRRWGIFGKE